MTDTPTDPTADVDSALKEEAIKKSPRLTRVGETIDEAKKEARKIFGEHGEHKFHDESDVPEPAEGNDDDLAGSAPLP